MKKLNFPLFPLCFAALTALALGSCGGPNYPECETDNQCADHAEFCVQGQCKQCGTDNHCKDGFTCQENACVPKPECTADSDCEGSCMQCSDEKCVPQCTADSDCKEGEGCSQGCCTKKEEPECLSDADCGEAQRCQKQKCIEAQPPEPETCNMQNVQFDYNEFSLTASARSVIDANLECIKKSKGTITLSGHADERGTEEYNLHLGEKRANAVKRYLVKMGVSESRLKAISFGEERPIANGHDEASWATNRRVEFSE